MKKILSFLLSFILAFTSVSTGMVSYATEKKHVEDALISLETKEGYIPGKTASVTYNCFAFVSDVCEQLYGVTYYYEQQKGNYQFNHTSNYYTVDETVLPYASSTSLRKSYALQLKNWLLENAAVGDVLQYGSADSSYSKKHTVLIQHIDEEKIQVLHSNYETKNISATAVRLDTIYWDSFTSDPTTNKYDSNGDLYSLDLLFGSTMKLTQGMGISINRYSYLESTYWLDTLSKYIPTISKTERKSCTSIKVSWNEVDSATAYSLEYKKQGDSEWTVASYSILNTYYTVKGLTTGCTYCFRVRAFAENEWKDYSTEAVKSALPPKPSDITVTAVLSGIQINWTTRNDISGCIIYRSDKKNGTYTELAVITDITQNSYIDTSITNGKTYYYKIQRFVYVDSQTVYSELSNANKGCFSLEVPSSVSVKSSSKTSVTVKWKAVEFATSYKVICKEKGTNNKITIKTKKLNCTIKGLTLGKKYKIKVKAVCSFGSSSYCKNVSITAKPKTTSVSATRKSGNIKLKWDKVSGVSGYYVYRAYSKNGKYTLIKTIKGKNNNSCSIRTYSSSKYYYKVKSYVKKGSTIYTSSYSKAVKA